MTCIGSNIKKIPGFKGYYITRQARVLSSKRARLAQIKPSLHRGYHRVRLRDNAGKKKNLRVHRLVAIAFVDNPKPEAWPTVNHIDGNRLHNHERNLEWASMACQIRHRDAVQANKEHLKELEYYWLQGEMSDAEYKEAVEATVKAVQ